MSRLSFFTALCALLLAQCNFGVLAWLGGQARSRSSAAVQHISSSSSSSSNRITSTAIYSSTETSELDTAAAAAESDEASIESIPTYLPSERGIDYVPLATMLATGDFLGADQFTRDNLIKISGPNSVKRGFVYWTEVKNLPKTDLITMERLWLQFSNGQFGYSVQKRVWDVENANFDRFIRRIGWTKVENGNERNLKWFVAN